eukprot:TRINITY_DN67401_c0_g1_i1.p1 TRINITY_DN67401_c0_g1~~TRINITY_DN67401_c0_g1_i1.p1  ORF type:complete len:303 (+),score=95.71 TRINITY_DN67401_c0_g1_i1:37-909(+)
MAVTENITVWLSLANTVFASIAFVIWYVQPGQEDHKKADESKVVIIDGDNVEDMYDQCNGDAMKDKVHIDTDSDEEKHLYVRPGLRNCGNLLNYRDYCCYQQNTPKQEGEDEVVAAAGEINTKKVVKFVDVDPKNVEDATKQIPKPTKNHTKPRDDTFKWPKNETTIEKLRAAQGQSKLAISIEVLDRIQSMGISRDSSVQTGQTVRLSDCARQSGQLLSKKQVSMEWDQFMAKNRPGLGMDKQQTKKRKQVNRQGKNKNGKQYKNDGSTAFSFKKNFSIDSCRDFVRAL